jgi:hypothetical protein
MRALQGRMGLDEMTTHQRWLPDVADLFSVEGEVPSRMQMQMQMQMDITVKVNQLPHTVLQPMPKYGLKSKRPINHLLSTRYFGNPTSTFKIDLGRCKIGRMKTHRRRHHRVYFELPCLTLEECLFLVLQILGRRSLLDLSLQIETHAFIVGPQTYRLL